MKLVTTNEAEVNAWFRELQEALGLSEGSDRGRVLKAVKSLVRKTEDYESEIREVANHYGYNKWGNFLNHVRESKVEPATALPKAFEQVPVKWVVGHGKPSYDVLERRLRKSVQPFVLRWLEENRGQLGEEDLEELVEAYETSESPEEFEAMLRADLGTSLGVKERDGRLTQGQLMEQLESQLRPYVASDEDYERLKSHEASWAEDRVNDWEAGLLAGGEVADGVARVLLEQPAFELAGFAPARNGEPPEWRALQVSGDLPHGGEVLAVLKRGLPHTKEEWLEASTAHKLDGQSKNFGL